MKNSFLTAITQPHPHRTSVHSHMQSTAYHYNSIINAKSQIDNSKPNRNSCYHVLNNRRQKNIKAQRISQNKKLLKSLVDIQTNYSLYGNKRQSQSPQHDQTDRNQFFKFKGKSLESRMNSSYNQKTLKNPFRQKMNQLKISEQNYKLFEKIKSTQSSINKKTIKQWGNRLDYLSSFLQSSREKQTCENLKNQFFQTYVKMRISQNSKGNTMQIQSKQFIPNPELNSLRTSKRILQKQGDLLFRQSIRILEKQGDVPVRQSIRIKHKKKMNGFFRRIDTEKDEQSKTQKFYTQNSEDYRQIMQ